MKLQFKPIPGTALGLLLPSQKQLEQPGKGWKMISVNLGKGSARPGAAEGEMWGVHGTNP